MAAGKSEQEGPKNPPYLDMIVAAIKADQSRTGTSKQVRGASSAGRARLALAIKRRGGVTEREKKPHRDSRRVYLWESLKFGRSEHCLFREREMGHERFS